MQKILVLDGWVRGWVDGWMGGKGGLRIAYSNQKASKQSSMIIRGRG